MKLTPSSVTALTLPEGKRDHIEWDDGLPAFGVRLRGDSKRWIIQYRIGQQQRRESLGDVRKVKLDDARAIARKRFAQVELGTDPGAERAKAREAAGVAALTLATVAVRYLDAKKDMLRPSTFNSAKRHFQVHFAPLGNRPISEIKRAEIAACLQQIIKQYGRTAAARARSSLNSSFAWSLREGLCEINPVIGTNDPGRGLRARDRVLGDRELAAVWKACRDDDFGRIVRLLILTGCRRDEIGSLQWSEIVGDVMTIAAVRSKNRKAHSLTLPPLALDILQSVPRRDGRDFVFGRRGGGFARWGHHTTALRARLGEMPPFVLHDLRRSFRTGLGKLGIPPHIAELAINHTRSGIEAVYDKHRYEREIASALAQWAAHVAAIIEGREGSNITTLRREASGERR
jgi:integrase